ncbi:LPXTG cell wall anchor domain-containing protein [Aeromicrobium sp. Sec7.5]|uniref:LPXTG cell wall anchor domain-containing protein n=1 Tax=Aeromicrobium sp. Sec7.5 TaxID=3121276 RepID=UPI002FE43112
MRRVLGSFAAVVALVATALMAGAPAQADVRAGYAVDDGVVVTIGGATVVGGNVVNVTVTATRTVDGTQVPVTCNVLRVSTSPDLVESFVGGGASTFDLELDTQVVDGRTPTVITATCEYAPFGPGSGTASASNVITLLSVGSDDAAASGILPRTGTEIGLWLVAVGALLVAGGAALVGRRRRA